ncbi:hypothetical protein BDR05DRAFT_668829 [Suillus weaverae]|nr:hypothetical protein BDR05DRAFT_668829 [Suillus weaverae]
MAHIASSPTTSPTSSIPHSERTDHSNSLSEFRTLIAIDANTYLDHKENVRLMQASMAVLTADVADLKDQMVAHKATLDAVYELAQASMDNSERIKESIHLAIDKIRDDACAAMRSEFAALKATLLERK